MARVTYGSYVTELTGSIAGTTYQRNFSGTIVRSKPNKIINPSNLLGTKQLILSYLVTQWNLLTTSQKTGWNDLAAAHDHTDPWGNVRTISGFQWFLSNNLNLSVIGIGVLKDAPAYLLPPPPPAYSLVFQSSEMLLSFVSSYNPAPYTLVIYATPPVRTTTSKTRKSVFTINIGSTPSSTDLNISSSYTAKFGYTIDQLLSYLNFTIVTRVCVIDPVTGFRSTYALNVSDTNLSWFFLNYLSLTTWFGQVGADINWGDGIHEALVYTGNFTISHNYPDNGSHHWYLDIYYNSTHHYADGNSIGTHGSITSILWWYGTLPPALNPSVQSLLTSTITFFWTDNSSDPGASASDFTLLACFCPSLNATVTAQLLGNRSDSSQVVTLPSYFIGKLTYCYIAFTKSDLSVNSNVTFAGTITPI